MTNHNVSNVSANDDDTADAEDIGYIDSRGAEIHPLYGPLRFHSALTAVRDLALDALPDEDEVRAMPGMKETYIHGIAAIDTVDLLLSDSAFLNGLEPSKEARDWPEDALLAQGLSTDPQSANGAVRIILAMGHAAARDPWTVQGIEDAEDIDLEQANLDMVADLLGMHGQALCAWKPTVGPVV